MHILGLSRLLLDFTNKQDSSNQDDQLPYLVSYSTQEDSGC